MDNDHQWIPICQINDIVPFSGVAALVGDEQVAIFRLDSESEAYAISNYDPFSRAYVLSRGIVGDKQGVLKVASPIYKHSFNLKTGECLDRPEVQLPTWSTRVVDGMVEVAIR